MAARRNETPNPALKSGDRWDLIFAASFAIVCGGIIASGAVWLSIHSQNILAQEKREDLQNQAALAALQFTAKEVEEIQGPQDSQKPIFRTLVLRAENI